MMGSGTTSCGSGNKNVIPESVMEAVKRTSENMEEMKTHLQQFMSYCDADILAKMEPLERAHDLFLPAKATTTLFTVRLRCKGVNPDNRSVKKELEFLEKASCELVKIKVALKDLYNLKIQTRMS